MNQIVQINCPVLNFGIYPGFLERLFSVADR